MRKSRRFFQKIIIWLYRGYLEHTDAVVIAIGTDNVIYYYNQLHCDNIKNY